MCSTNSICRAFESINRSPSKAKEVGVGVVDASKAENGRQILCPWLSTSRTMMMGRYCEEGDDGGAMPFMCSRWSLFGERGEGRYMGEIRRQIWMSFLEFRVLWCSRKEGGGVGRRRSSHPLRATDGRFGRRRKSTLRDDEEEEPERWKNIVVSRPIDRISNTISSSSSSSSALKTSRFIIAYIIIMPSEDQQQQQQQQQQHRSTARRDQLTAYQTSAQASWSTSKAFEVNADAEKTIKFFGNFPYPYMNGLLHLGHAFSLSKLVRLNVHEHSLSEPRSKEKEDALASKHSSGWSGMGWRTLFSMTR